MAYGDVVPMTPANYMALQFNGTLQGQSVIQRIGYLANVGSPTALVPADIAAYVKANVWDSGLKLNLVDSYMLESIYVQTGGLGGAAIPTAEFTLPVAEQGALVGNALPAWVAVGIYMVPSNDPIYSDDPSAPLFLRKSYYRFSGISEAQQDNGLVEPSTVSSFESIVVSLKAMLINGTPFEARVTRPTNTLVGGNQPAYTVLIGGGVRQKLSSMISRKY